MSKRRELVKNLSVDAWTEYDVVCDENRHVHWGYWVFWLLVLWPVLIVLLVVVYTRKIYCVKLYRHRDKKVVWVDKQTLNEIKINLKEKVSRY